MRIRVATLNIRGVLDRWPERRPLLVAAFRAIAPDVAGLQEVSFDDGRQAELLAGAVPGRSYQAFAGETRLGFGNAILVAEAAATAHESISLDYWRVAHRVRLALPGGRTLWFANTHLHHVAADPHIRADQARRVCAWLAAAPDADACVVVGDWNALPDDAACTAMTEAGYRSAHRDVHGDEPPVTWPSGIQAPTMDTEGDRGCLDYVWVRGGVRVATAAVAADRPAPHDGTLFPSDHFAVVAELDLV